MISILVAHVVSDLGQANCFGLVLDQDFRVMSAGNGASERMYAGQP